MALGSKVLAVSWQLQRSRRDFGGVVDAWILDDYPFLVIKGSQTPMACKVETTVGMGTMGQWGALCTGPQHSLRPSSPPPSAIPLLQQVAGSSALGSLAHASGRVPALPWSRRQGGCDSWQLMK